MQCVFEYAYASSVIGSVLVELFVLLINNDYDTYARAFNQNRSRADRFSAYSKSNYGYEK